MKEWSVGSEVERVATREGGHGSHWAAAVGYKTLEGNPALVLSKIDTVFLNGDKELVAEDYFRSCLFEGDVGAQVITTEKKEVITGFPVLKSATTVQGQLKKIIEWEHIDRLEAEVSAMGGQTFGLTYFATDYLEHRAMYRRYEEVPLRLAGFAYSVSLLTELPEHYSPDFVGYLPTLDVSEPSSYSFVGEIESARACGDGVILSTCLVRGGEGRERFVLDIYVHQENCHVKEIDFGMKIEGVFWLQGAIDLESTLS